MIPAKSRKIDEEEKEGAKKCEGNTHSKAKISEAANLIAKHFINVQPEFNAQYAEIGLSLDDFNHYLKKGYKDTEIITAYSMCFDRTGRKKIMVLLDNDQIARTKEEKNRRIINYLSYR